MKRLAPAAPPPAEILKDDFDERFKLDWQIRNADLSRISLTKKPNTLTITTQDASFYGGSTNHRNLLLTANPIKGDGEFEITTCLIGFDPKVNYQQAGLVCLDDEDNYIKWTYEWNEARGRQVLALIRETAAAPAPHTYVYEIPQGDKVWLRLTKQGNRYAYSASSDGQSFRVHGAVAWGDSAPSWLGLLAWNANTRAPEIDASFDFFEVNPQPTITVPPIQPESVLSEERLLDLQLRNLLSQQKLDEETRRQYARYNLDSIRRRIQSARQLLALIGSQALWPDEADAWVNGNPVSAGDRKGKVVLLDFWAVWCGPCIATFPHLRQWREKYGDQGFEIIGVTKYYNCDWDDEAGRIQRVPDLTPEKELDALKRFAAHHDLKHPFAVMAETSLHEHYVVSGIPHVVLIDRGNKVRLIRTGSGEQTALEVEKMIETCLAESKTDL